MRRQGLACSAFIQPINVDVLVQYPQGHLRLLVRCTGASSTGWCVFPTFIRRHPWLSQCPPAPQVCVFSRLPFGDVLGSINAHPGHRNRPSSAYTRRSPECNGLVNRDTPENSCTWQKMQRRRASARFAKPKRSSPSQHCA